jgi:hypothetical protein
MTASLESISTRTSQLLMDTGGLIWDAAAITEAVRLALGEYNQIYHTGVTLSGLDGAATTSLPENNTTLIVAGAAGYAAVARAAARSESFNLGSEAQTWLSWGEARLADFRSLAQLDAGQTREAARKTELRQSTNPAWGTWEDGDEVSWIIRQP